MHGEGRPRAEEGALPTGWGWGVTWRRQQFHKDFSKASWLLPAICPHGMPMPGSPTNVTAGNSLI